MDDTINNIEVKDAEAVFTGTVIRPFTEEQIEAHAAKCGGRRNLREIEILNDDNEKFVYLVKKPSRAVMQAIAFEGSKKDKMNTDTIQNLMIGCVLEGDREAYEYDGAIYTQLVKEIGVLSRKAKGDIKKL